MQTIRKLNQANLIAFKDAYRDGLYQAFQSHPQDYGFAPEALPFVAAKMTEAIESGSCNHDGRGFKNACKIVGIKHTRTAIEAFITAA